MVKFPVICLVYHWSSNCSGLSHKMLAAVFASAAFSLVKRKTKTPGLFLGNIEELRFDNGTSDRQALSWTTIAVFAVVVTCGGLLKR